MNNKTEKNSTNRFIASAIFFILFLQIVIMVLFFDVDKIGPMGTEIGCSHINSAFHNITGTNIFLYDITTYLGIFAILVCVIFAFVGLVQLIKRRSIIKVDNEILMLGGFYLIVIGFYILFEKVAINYRPVIMPGETFPEASFPSSHTMLIVCVMGGAILMAAKYIPKKGIRIPVQIICAIVLAFTVVGRLLCGVHWFTDIVGGVMISIALLLMFTGFLIKFGTAEEV